MAQGMWKLGSGKATNLTETLPFVQLRFNIQNCMSLSWLTTLVAYAVITKHLLNFHFRGRDCGSHHEPKALRFPAEFRHLPPQSSGGPSSFRIQYMLHINLQTDPQNAKCWAHLCVQKETGKKKKWYIFSIHKAYFWVILQALSLPLRKTRAEVFT